MSWAATLPQSMLYPDGQHPPAGAHFTSTPNPDGSTNVYVHHTTNGAQSTPAPPPPPPQPQMPHMMPMPYPMPMPIQIPAPQPTFIPYPAPPPPSYGCHHHCQQPPPPYGCHHHFQQQYQPQQRRPIIIVNQDAPKPPTPPKKEEEKKENKGDGKAENKGGGKEEGKGKDKEEKKEKEETKPPPPPKEPRKFSNFSIVSIIMFALALIFGIACVVKTYEAFDEHIAGADMSDKNYADTRTVAMGTGGASSVLFTIATLSSFYAGIRHKSKTKGEGHCCLGGFVIAGWIIFCLTFINNVIIMVLAFDEKNIIYPEVVWSALLGSIVSWMLMFGYSEMARRG